MKVKGLMILLSHQPEVLAAFTKNPKKVIKAVMLKLESRSDPKFSQNDYKVTVAPDISHIC